VMFKVSRVSSYVPSTYFSAPYAVKITRLPLLCCRPLAAFWLPAPRLWSLAEVPRVSGELLEIV
jgi:hypothetical protein